MAEDTADKIVMEGCPYCIEENQEPCCSAEPQIGLNNYRYRKLTRTDFLKCLQFWLECPDYQHARQVVFNERAST